MSSACESTTAGCGNCGATLVGRAVQGGVLRFNPTAMSSAAATALPSQPASTAETSTNQSPPTNLQLPRIYTPQQYQASLKGRNLRVFLSGKCLSEPAAHPVVAPSVRAVAATYQLGIDRPQLGLANYKGRCYSRFLHVCRSVDDVVKQNLMQRELGRRTGTCFQRCVGMDAINACFSVTYDIDQATQEKQARTSYHSKFNKWLDEMQCNNFVVGGAMTDPKGNRALSPSQQTDQDLHARVVERRVDGLVIRGAKLHQTGSINAHWLLVMPGGRLQKEDAQFAFVCAVPVTASGLTFVYGRQSCDNRALEAGTTIDQGNAQFGGQEATILFEDVLVPYSHVFMDGQYQFAQSLVERFTAYHRRSYICKAGLGDVLMGAAATVAEYNGVSKASHVRDKLVEMAFLNETIAGTALAASHQATPTPAGNFLPDVLLANVCKHNVTRHPYELARLAQDLAGGLVVTMPADADFQHPAVGPLLQKYLATAPGVSVDNRRRILRLIENMTLGRNAVGYLTESLHGAGSPEAQRVLIRRLMDLPSKQKLARRLAGIEDNPNYTNLFLSQAAGEPAPTSAGEASVVAADYPDWVGPSGLSPDALVSGLSQTVIRRIRQSGVRDIEDLTST
eukprot:gb/GEZN01004180.1/.p1 GENE.gb/GEZN01004180.1/~~gb/GEZN01004180.1/.p1  ORF type:complete len:622 (-),score=100.59 gb/GEZN01004180.1/:33-1898(-)